MSVCTFAEQEDLLDVVDLLTGHVELAASGHNVPQRADGFVSLSVATVQLLAALHLGLVIVVGVIIIAIIVVVVVVAVVLVSSGYFAGGRALFGRDLVEEAQELGMVLDHGDDEQTRPRLQYELEYDVHAVLGLVAHRVGELDVELQPADDTRAQKALGRIAAAAAADAHLASSSGGRTATATSVGQHKTGGAIVHIVTAHFFVLLFLLLLVVVQLDHVVGVVVRGRRRRRRRWRRQRVDGR